MKCYCYKTEAELIFCVEDVETEYEVNLHAAWFTKTDNGFTKIYPMVDKENGVESEDKELIIRNFTRLGQSMFEGVFDWKNVLSLLAKKFRDNEIEWYIIGSISDAVLGVDIKPHDLDIIVHTRDFFKVKRIFSDYVVEPFVDNKGTWLVRYFGRLCLDGAIVDIAADEKMNLENHQHPYTRTSWNGYDVIIEPLQDRYEVEIKRNRIDRIKAIETHMKYCDGSPDQHNPQN
ncbi:MAG: nucleotidyltransferase family protein [Armatimonadota bacterium]